MSLGILKYPHPILKEIAQDVLLEEINDDFRATIAEMTELMIEANGVGLAAIQVGIKKRFFIMHNNLESETPEIITIINPKIIDQGGKIVDEEGCLSFPGVSAKVNRATKVKIKALNEFGEEIEIEKDGFLARCIQHEIDHLNGVTFFDHLGSLKRKIIEKKYKKLIQENANA
ncbi:peptide deformylase [Francisella orientalis]|uniref:Peptide deformylase n=1 Tax=Francisella orientalis TaxID=299583 RepID=A0AAP7C4X2_9GAMM|nr:peptide deformylase [Francisella orientalis]AFJ42650.1 peptide deformylase [Francisella orientalis str. Toba 04]AHB97804.1 peptide deformylase [Francisella orientalis LADL 07-285A]AKN84897.1 Peptide deformylase [Francisella orientalis FNO12]AKN86435.1 Peptide deformylase [Francisella orientalis FNO24]AKN87973.1 Peptide deformylase [Francisella orientalis]